MPTVVGVRLRNAPKPVLFDTGDTEVGPEDIVVVVTDRGEEPGRALTEPRELAEGESLDPAQRFGRVATEDDLRLIEDLHRREKEAMPVFRRLVAKHELEMKPVDVEYFFDSSRIVFYFAAEGRVDFRELVRDLASEFHARIDMRQIGVRDEARMIGGLGHCGEQLCCVRFGGDFQPVSIRMAKEQDLPLNPLKISGLCGRLMCCLRYEFEAYKDFKGRAPKKGAIVEVGDSKGKVVDFNTPRETVTMRLEEGGSVTVALSDMECGSGAGCPCRVRAEALAKPASALSEAVAAVASVTPATPQAAEGDGESGRGGGRRRRRRSGGAGAQASGGAQATGQADSGAGQQAGAQRRQRQRSAHQQPQAQRPKAAESKPAPAEGQQPSSTPGRRRRRRRSGGGGGAPAAE